MPKFRQAVPDVPIVVMTAFGELSTAVAAVRNGAFDYLSKPFDLAVAPAAPSSERLEQAARPAAATEPIAQNDGEPPIVGTSPAHAKRFSNVFAMLVARRMRAYTCTAKVARARSWLPVLSTATVVAAMGRSLL